MEGMKKTIATGASSILLLAGMGAGVQAMATEMDGISAGGGAVEAIASGVSADTVVREATVFGVFTFSQDVITPNEVIKSGIGSASKYLCGAGAASSGSASVGEWPILVSGTVSNEISMTYEDAAGSFGARKMTMSCTCMGNPVDGRATATADVRGLSVNELLSAANPTDGANTVVVTSADGYQMELPLWYVMQHNCLLVFDVNGAPLIDSVGGTNQLWLGSTPASYFVRDVVSITVEVRDAAPLSPTCEEMRAEYAANLPNIGVIFGGTIR